MKNHKIQISTLVLVSPLLSLSFSCKAPIKKEIGYSDKQKPNIIYILADDLGYGQLGSYGQEKIETPNIDALAKNGMQFSNHYAGSSLSSPSRCVLLTGMHLGHAQIRSNDEMSERGDVWDYVKTQESPELEGQFPLKGGTQTIGTLLQGAGYKTAVIGKWGLGGPLTEGAPNKQGFDFFYGHNCQRQAWNYYPRYLWNNPDKVWLNNELIIPGTKDKKTKLPKNLDPYDPDSYSGYTLNEYAPDLMQKEVINFIRENRDHPFFMFYATPIPHTSLQVPKRWVEYYHEKFGDEEPYLGEKNYFPVRYPRATFAAMVSYLDEQVGELVAELKELGLDKNTLIIFTSDNGPASAGGTDSPWFDGAKPFRSGQSFVKGSLYEGGIRIPMIAKWPGKIEAGSQTDLISAFYDVLPTLCDVAGIDTPQDIDGISFLPTLLKEKVQKEHDFLYWEHIGQGGQQAIRMGKWKGLRKDILEGKLHIQLFNLENDIQELNDVSSEFPEIIQKMQRVLAAEHKVPDNKNFRMESLSH